MEAALNLNEIGRTLAFNSGLCRKSVVLAQSPSESFESSLFHWLANDVTLFKFDESVRSGKSQSRVKASVVDADKLGLGAIGFTGDVLLAERQASDTLNVEILASQSTGLVKASNIHTSCIGDSERLCAEDGVLAECGQTSVDSQAQLHRQLWGHDGGNDKNTVEKQLRALAVVANTLGPDVPGGGNGEDTEEENEHESLDVVGADALGGVDHGADKTTLVGLEASLENDRKCSVVRRLRHTRSDLADSLSSFLGRSAVLHLKDLGATPEECVLVETFRFNTGVGRTKLDGVFQHRRALAGKHGLVDDSTAFNQNHVASNTRVFLGAAHTDQITGKKLIALSLDPLVSTEHPDVVRLDAHASEFLEGALALPDDSRLEHNQHEKCEERVVPVFVEHPETDAENLEHKERRDSVLLEELRESRHGDIEDVRSVLLSDVFDIRVLAHTPRFLEVADEWLRLLVHLEYQRRKASGVLIVHESSLLEQEAQVLLAANLVPIDIAYFRSASVRIRNNLDQLGGLDIVGAHSCEKSSDVDIPESSEPDQALESEDGAAEDEGPFLAVDVLVVAFLREVDGEEGWPDAEEGPDVVMKEDVFRIMEGGGSDLRVIH